MNKVFYEGRVGRDLELKIINSNLTVSQTAIAQERKISKNQSKTQWLNLTFRNKGRYLLAEYAFRDIKKGDDLHIEGELIINEKDGRTFASVDVIDFKIIATAETREAMRSVMKVRQESTQQPEPATPATPATPQKPISSFGSFPTQPNESNTAIDW